MGESFEHVRDRLLSAGWSLSATGDWAWVYRSPDGARAARLCPYDPGHRLHVRHCQQNDGEPFLSELLEVRELAGCGQLVVMPWYEEATEVEARELVARVGRVHEAAGVLGETRARALAEEGARDPGIQSLRRVLDAMAEEGARTLPFFGGLDLNPGNVRKTREGQLKLVDSAYVAGRNLIAALMHDAQLVARQIPVAELRAFLRIACFRDAEPDPKFQALRAAVERLEG